MAPLKKASLKVRLQSYALQIASGARISLADNLDRRIHSHRAQLSHRRPGVPGVRTRCWARASPIAAETKDVKAFVCTGCSLSWCI